MKALILALWLSCHLAVQAQIVFQQGFDAGGTPANYVGSGPNLFDAIGTSGVGVSWGIVDGTLQGTRSDTSTGNITRFTDLPLQDAYYFQALVNVIDITAPSTSALVFYFGNNLAGGTSTPSLANSHARFSIDFANAATEEWRVRHFGGSAQGPLVTGQQLITLVSSNTGATESYDLGGGISGTVANDTIDLWIGSTRIFDDLAATGNTTNAITDFKVLWSSGSGTVAIDNITLGVIPEPGTVAAVCTGVFILGGWRRFSRRIWQSTES